MGYFVSKELNLDNDDNNYYLLEGKDAKAMKKLWNAVENGPSHYGWIFSRILFRNHPQYIKYFREENIPEYIEDAKTKKKFTAICSIISLLFINYLKKPKQRDNVLGYIAMIHKDMQLTSRDLDNFMMDLLEMLAQERPKFMNNRHRDLIVQYFGGLLRRIEYLMEVHRNNDSRMIRSLKKSQKRVCGLKSCCGSPTIYGCSIEFWIAKKEYWQHRLAMWSLSHNDVPVWEKNKKVPGTENVRFNISKGTVSRNRKKVVKTSSPAKIDTTNSESASNTLPQDDVKTSKNKRYYMRRDTLPPSTTGPMEIIPEATSSALNNVKSPPRRKVSPKTTQAFLDAVEALKTSSIHSDTERSSNESSSKRTSMIDTARERKRVRNKKLNAVQSASDSKKIIDSDTLITGKAEKFAKALAKRKTQ